VTRAEWIAKMEAAWREDNFDEPPRKFIETLSWYVNHVQDRPAPPPPMPPPAPHPQDTPEYRAREADEARSFRRVFALVTVAFVCLALLVVGLASVWR
jgi:hypothetical protein